MCVRVYALYNTLGTTATTGLKDVAELGSTFTLLGEVNRLNCYSGDRIRSGGLGDATGSLVDYLNVDRCSALHVAVCVCVHACVCLYFEVCMRTWSTWSCILYSEMYAACGWPVAGLWLACGWPVAGLWLACGWPVAGLWLACGWPVAGLWLARVYARMVRRSHVRSLAENCIFTEIETRTLSLCVVAVKFVSSK